MWKDLLTSYNGQSITYDTIGNPLSYRGMTLTWANGRQLATLTKSGATSSYSYDINGNRTKKVANGVTTEYYLNEGTIVAEKAGSNVIRYLFDENGDRFGLEYNGSKYVYLFNAQGDVVAIVNSSNQLVAKYAYDAWGKLLSITGSAASTVGAANPIRYRGYYYDTETGFYLTGTRYYDPVVGRFINADSTVSTGQGLIGTNMFAYCGNNPICRYDPTGRSFLAAIGIGLLVTGIVTLCTSSNAETPSTIEVPDWDCNIVFNEPTVGEPNSKREWPLSSPGWHPGHRPIP